MSKICSIEKAPLLKKSGASREIDKLRKNVLDSKSPILQKKIIHYISESGDDNNDGLTPQTSLKTIDGLRRSELHPGHAVLFERGGTYRFKDALVINGGVYYGAYGTGAKPKLLGSVEDYAHPNKWQLFEEGIWVLSLPLSDAGMMNFNYDTYIGVKKRSYSDLLNEGDFFHDLQEKKLFFKFSDGNPGEYFDNIEIATTEYIFQVFNVNNIAIDNFCIKYASCFGIKAADVSDIAIKNCEIGWIGGIYIGKNTNERYGNGIEFWYKAENITVDNCWIYQAYDAALTFQGNGPGITTFRNIKFENNLIEYCSMNFEYWVRYFDENNQRVAVGIMHSIRFCNNILRGAGYGWGGKQRLIKPNQAFILGWNNVYREDILKDFYIMDNVFDTADCSMIYAAPPSMQKGLYVSHNKYYQKKPTGLNTHNQIIRIFDINATNQEELEKAIKMFDSNPDLIKWIED